jgi:hypothetical protein
MIELKVMCILKTRLIYTRFRNSGAMGVRAYNVRVLFRFCPTQHKTSAHTASVRSVPHATLGIICCAHFQFAVSVVKNTAGPKVSINFVCVFVLLRQVTTA